MKLYLLPLLFILFTGTASAQKTKTLKYPSILWEISSKKTGKKSYLFGTYHISMKNVFHLSDSFYIAIKNSDVIATESLESNWEEEFYQKPFYAPETFSDIKDWRGEYYQDYLAEFGMNSFGFNNYEKELEKKFDAYPSIIKGIISRVYNEDFSEDTYLDHYIYKLGRRLNKTSIGLENFRESNDIVLQASINRELDRKNTNFSFENRVNQDDVLDAYIKNNLDDLDSLSVLSDNSEPYREKMLYERNDIQARQIDSFIRNNQTIFAAVGCAHLPGKRGVIEALRNMGYQLRPIIATQKADGTNNQYKDQIVKKQFSTQTSSDKFITVRTPGKLYSFVKNTFEEFLQSVDVDNDAYFLITRLKFNYHLQGDNEKSALKKLDSLFYDNIPGDILEKKLIEKNSYKGYEISSRKKTGMYQKFQIFVTPTEIIYFKSYSTETFYTKSGYVDSFFKSIQLGAPAKALGNSGYSPKPYAVFKAAFPYEPTVVKNFNRATTRWEYYTADSINDYTVIRNYRFDTDFGGDDSLDLQLMKHSYQHSFFIDSCVSSDYRMLNGHNALFCTFVHKNQSISKVCFTLKGNEFYSVIGHSSKANNQLDQFINSFEFTKPVLPETKLYVDTFYNFSVRSPFFYDSTTISHRRAAYEWIQKYKGNKEFETRLKADQGTERSFLFDDTLGYRIYFQDLTALQKNIADQFPDSVYLRKIKYDTSLISKYDYVMMTDALRGKFYIKQFSKQVMPDSSIERTLIAGWPRSSRNSFIKVIELPGKDLLRKISFQFDSLETVSPQYAIAASYKINDAGKIIAKDNFPSLIEKLVRNDTAIEKTIYADLFKSLQGNIDRYYPNIVNGIQQLPASAKNYLRIKERLIAALGYIPTKECTDFLAGYFEKMEDTFSLRKACLVSLFSQQTGYALEKGMKFLLEDPDADYAGSESPLSTYLRLASSRYNKRNTAEDPYEILAGYNNELASLLYESAWKEEALRALSILQEKKLLKKKAVSKYLPKLLQFAKKEIRKSKQSDMRRIEAAKTRDADDDDSPVVSSFASILSSSNYSSGNYSSERENSSSLFIPICNILLPFRQSNAEVQDLFDQVWKLDTSNSLRKSFLTFSLIKKLDFPDSVLKQYLGNETRAYSFIKDAYRDSIDLCTKYQISITDLGRYMLLKDNIAGNRNYIDSFSLVKTETIEQKDSIHTIFYYKTWLKKDRKNFAWNICKLTRSRSSGKYIFRDCLKVSTNYSTLNSTISSIDMEQLYLRILFDEYRPVTRFFNNTKGYMNFIITYP